MRQKVIYSVVFFCVFLICDRILGKVVSNYVQSKVYDKRISDLAKNELKPDIFIVGSSLAARNIDPIQLTNNTGKEHFNLGYPGSNLTFHRLLINLILSNEKLPKLIILTASDNLLEDTRLKKGGVSFREDIANQFISFPVVKRALIDLDLKDKYLCELSHVYRENANFNSAINFLVFGREKQTSLTKVGQKGYMIRSDKKSITHDTLQYINEGKYYSQENESNKLIEDFTFIVESLKVKGVNFVVALPPQYQSATDLFIERLEEFDSNIEVWDYRESLKEKEYFFDRVHLNLNGAKKFNDMLTNKINTHFEKNN